tara:strand:+ start:119 stop:1408 length:1290 start_codon:yes stop_codon:yes gene_type:complete
MINRTGLNGLNRNLSNPKGSQDKFNNSLATLNSKVVTGRVTDIVLDENHPKFNEVGGLNGIGTIFYELDNLVSTKDDQIAKPLHPQNKTFPLINEMILLFALPDNEIGESNNSKSYYYINNINIWNHPHHNAYPSPIESTLPPSQKKDYQQVEGGSVRRIIDESTEINLNSPLNPSQNTFIERTNIHPLMPFMGDIMYEGRFGQSLRLGTTSKSKSIYKNSWSTVGDNGDPITILRNGQPNNSSDRGWIPITENINSDLSSIYLTSYQKLNNFNVASKELYDSYKIKPTTPSQYSNPQIVLNSDRIIINAKNDHILLSSQKSIGMSTVGSVNIDAVSHCISSNDIKLGSIRAEQPVLLGDNTVEVLILLTEAVKNLASILEVQKDWPGGALKTSFNAIAGNVITQIDSDDGILSLLNNNSLKSKTTKVQ